LFDLLQVLAPFVQNSQSGVARRIRSRMYRTHAYIDTEVAILNRHNFHAGEGCALYHGCYIANAKGRFSMGENSHLGAFCYVNAQKGNVSVGDDVAVGPGTKIIAYSNHFEKGRKVSQVRICEDIVIHNNVFIGANCVILPGAVIRDNVVVGAGSVVKGELAANAVYAGSPCRKIRDGWYE